MSKSKCHLDIAQKLSEKWNGQGETTLSIPFFGELQWLAFRSTSTMYWGASGFRLLTETSNDNQEGYASAPLYSYFYHCVERHKVILFSSGIPPNKD